MGDRPGGDLEQRRPVIRGHLVPKVLYNLVNLMASMYEWTGSSRT